MLCLPFCACGSRSWRTPRKMRREQSQYLRTLRLLIYQCRSRRSVGRLLLPRTASDIRPDAKKLKIAYPVVVGNDNVEKGFGGIWGFPTTFLITRKGQIYKKYTGMYPQQQAQLEADIQKLLAEKP